MQRFINLAVFFTLSLLVALGIFNYTTNRVQEESFRNKGLRFTYCDGFFIYRELHPGIKEDPQCEFEKDTDFQKFLR